MLSASHTVNDIKAELGHAYDYYDFATDLAFVSAIERVVADIRLRLLIPRIGVTAYSNIALKNKTSLTLYEEYLYWAEIFFSCHYFLKWALLAVANQSSSVGAGQSLQVEGYKISSTSGATSSSNTESTGAGARSVYYSKGLDYMTLAGYPMGQLVRGNSAYGQGSFLLEETE